MNTVTQIEIRPRDRDAVITSLRAGVVPRTGQHLIQVGRVREIESMVMDVDRLCDGGSTFRIVSGEYGAGKTFFLNLVRAVATKKNLVTSSADLNPDRRLHATGGQARSLYAELMRNVSTRTKPDGGALGGIVEKFIAQSQDEARASEVDTETIIRRKLSDLTELVNGFDFADVIAAYCRGHKEDDEVLKQSALRWLRGEYSTKTEARQALGVRAIVDDSNFYDQLKLFSRFVRLAGYSGFLVCLDELVNLYKLTNPQARNANYEQILRILNDSLQGAANGLGIIMGGTPAFISDPRKGLYSYQALQSRLAENEFVKNGLSDFTGPVIRLASLTAEDYYVLLEKVRHVYAFGDESKYLIPDLAIRSFMAHCAQKLGEEYFRTPRTTITSFINLLATLEQNPEFGWQDLLGKLEIAPDQEEQLADEQADELTTFKL